VDIIASYAMAAACAAIAVWGVTFANTRALLAGFSSLSNAADMGYF
jgi:hypothetical protein